MSKQKLELYQEYPQPGEEEVTRQLIEYTKKVMVEKDFLTGTTNRDVHGKGIPAIKGELIVDTDLPAEFRHGVFQPGKRYPVWVRFSSSSQKPQPDIKKDIRGVGVKLMGVPGEKLLPEQKDATTQDFVFLSTETFFTRDTKDFFGLFKALNTNLFALLWFSLTHPAVFLALLRGRKRIANFLEHQYWSTTPYRLGEIAVKYSLKPVAPVESAIPDDPGNNYLTEAADRQLSSSEVRFDFLIQVQKDPYKQPIEDGLAVWSERLAPFRKAATLRLPVQHMATAERRQIAENLSMNIWHALPEHRPLGNLNRSRGEIYRAISKFRHERNVEPLVEPTAGPDFLTTP
jgi:catalase